MAAANGSRWGSPRPAAQLTAGGASARQRGARRRGHAERCCFRSWRRGAVARGSHRAGRDGIVVDGGQVAGGLEVALPGVVHIRVAAAWLADEQRKGLRCRGKQWGDRRRKRCWSAGSREYKLASQIGKQAAAERQRGTNALVQGTLSRGKPSCKPFLMHHWPDKTGSSSWESPQSGRRPGQTR